MIVFLPTSIPEFSLLHVSKTTEPVPYLCLADFPPINKRKINSHFCAYIEIPPAGDHSFKRVLRMGIKKVADNVLRVAPGTYAKNVFLCMNAHIWGFQDIQYFTFSPWFFFSKDWAAINDIAAFTEKDLSSNRYYLKLLNSQQLYDSDILYLHYDIKEQ